ANVMVIAWDAVKLVPVTVMLVPTGPWLGLKVIPLVTLNVAETEFVPSVAVTVCPVADAPLGTVKEQDCKAPLLVEEQVVTWVPSNVMVMVLFGMKLLPATVTLVPTGPELGLKLIAGVVTVKVAV